MSSHVADFNARNQILTAKILKQGYRYHKLCKTFSKFYQRHYDLVSKFNTGLKALLKQCVSEHEFYGDLVYKFKKIVGQTDFSDHFRKIIICYKRIGYKMNEISVEYSSCFISVMNLDLYVRCFDSLMSRGPSRGPNNLHVYMNHNRT